jgi:VCBS repeat-containing protein
MHGKHARRRRPLHILAFAMTLGVAAGSLGVRPASAATTETASLTIRLFGLLGGENKRVTGACFNIYGYDNGNPGMEVRNGVCDIDDGVLQLTNLPMPPDRKFLINPYDAPDLILGDSVTQNQSMQFGRKDWFDMGANTSKDLIHVRAGTAHVTGWGPTSEDDLTNREFTPCFSVNRETVGGEVGQLMGIYCNTTEITDLEPDSYRFTARPFEGHLGGEFVRRYIPEAMTTDVVIPTPLAPDFTVYARDQHGDPLTGACYDMVAVDVPGYDAGDTVAQACDSYPGPNDGKTVFVDIDPGSYTLVQTSAANGYQLAADQPVGVSPIPLACPAGACPTNSVTVTNTPLPVVRVHAVGSNNQPLPGGCYQLGYYRESGGYYLTLGVRFQSVAFGCDSYDGNDDGLTDMGAVLPGDYVLRDWESPAGMDPADDQDVTVAGDTDVIVHYGGAAANQPPVAVTDAVATDEDTAVSGNVLSNDSDAEGPGLAASIASQPANGTVVLGADGSFTYTPNADYSGLDSFTYEVSDGTAVAIGTVDVTITPVNDAPVAVADAATTAQDAPVTIDVLANDTDVDSSALTAAVASGPAHGTVTAAPGGSLVYTPAAGYSGADSFTYTVSDGQLTATTTVAVTVTPAPVTDPVGDTIQRLRTIVAQLQGTPKAKDLAKDIDDIVKHLGKGNSACAQTQKLSKDLGDKAVVKAIGQANADWLRGLVTQLGQTMSCKKF